MEHLVLSGFADEIAPEFDKQLEAVTQWGLTHIELRAADGVNVSDFTPEKVKEVKGSWPPAGVGQCPPSAPPLGRSALGTTSPPTWRNSSAPWKSKRSWGALSPHVQLLPAPGGGPRPLS